MSNHLDGAGAVDAWIATVCLNDVVGLSRTLWSIAGQEGVRLGVVIADGGSMDGSLELALAYKRRNPATIVLPGPDGGIYQGMNRALAAVPEDTNVWFLNAGDFFTDSRAASRVIKIVGGDALWAGGPILPVRPSGLISDPTSLPRIGKGTNAILPAQPSIVAKKSVWEDEGGFREDLRLASDGVLIAKIAQRHEVRVYESPSVFFMLGGRSSANIRRTIRELRSASPSSNENGVRGMADSWTVAKTRARSFAFAIEHRLNRLGFKWLLPERTSVAHFPHWLHPRPRPDGIRCCEEAGRRFGSLVLGDSG